MPNEQLLKILNETYSEVAAQRATAIGSLQSHQQAVGDAEANVKQAAHQETLAVTADENVKGEAEALRVHINGQTEPSQALIEKLSRLGATQLQTYRKRRDAGEITRVRRSELSQAQTELAVAQQNLDRLSAQIQDLSAQIEAARK
jgi:hypothetical protein